MIDLFDGVNNDALLIEDCDGTRNPHHWLGDGYCDDGTDVDDGGGNFNCNIFLCDDGDCGDTCAVVEGRDQVEVAPDSGENMLSESMRAKWRDSWGRKQMRQEMSCTGG